MGELSRRPSTQAMEADGSGWACACARVGEESIKDEAQGSLWKLGMWRGHPWRRRFGIWDTLSVKGSLG